jgi:hypothetical protein
MTSRITQSDLLHFVNHRDTQMGKNANCTLRQYRAALFVLDHFLGPEWVEAHVFRDPKDTRFLHPAHVNWQDQYKHQDRVVALAEIFFNLQDIDGFGIRVQRIRTGDVETSLGELDGARLLYISGVNFRFVPEKGIAGEDYDVEAVLDSTNVPCEMKTKLESTDLTVETIRRTLQKARRQLPSEGLGIVFFKVPETWPQQPKALETVQEALSGFFRNTGRVALVVLHWEHWLRLTSDRVGRVVMFRSELNPKPRVTLSAIGDLVKGLDSEQHPRQWKDFAKLVCPPEEIAKAAVIEQAFILSTTERWSPPPQGVGVRYDGDLDHLLTQPPGDVITVVDFECDGFELFDSILGAKSCEVTLSNHEVSPFSVYRGKEQSQYQIQLPGLIYDAGLTTHKGAIVVPTNRVKKMQERLQAGARCPDDVDEDEFLQKLRALFMAMRVAGDLKQSIHELRELSVTYWIKSENAPVFAAMYFGRGIKV